MHKPIAQPARATAAVANELQATSALRSAVVAQRAELDRDLDAAVAACIRVGTTAAYEKLHARAGALRDLAGKLAEREAALNTELRQCEAWDRDAPRRAELAAQDRERARIASDPQNAVPVVEAAVAAADPQGKHWQSRGYGSCAPADVAALPGCRLGGDGEPFAVIANRTALDAALKEHRDALARGGARGVLESITRKNARPVQWHTPGQSHVTSII